jgi:EmrB/QacA subfamily drug resistance transporter
MALQQCKPLGKAIMHTKSPGHRARNHPDRTDVAGHPDAGTNKQSRVDGPDGRKPWSLLVLLCIPQFMVILDVTVVNVALPSIGRDLGFATVDLQWVVSAYVLVTGGLMLLGGRGADLIGRRPVFLAGLAVFTAASLASGLAPTPATLIASRACQGLGAALLSPAALSIITATYKGPQRTTALSVWGALAGGGGAVGVLLGGVLTSWLGWRSIFFINVPLGVLTTVLALRMLPASKPAAGALRALDLRGALTLISGLVLLVFAIRESSRWGWDSARTLLLLAAAGGLLTAFAVVERRASRPLVPPAIWRVRSLLSSTIVMLGITAILVGTFFLGSLFLQRVLGASPIQTGLDFLPLVLVTGLASHLGRELLARVGARVTVVAGLVLIAAGDLLLAGANAHSSYIVDMLPAFALIGFGIGLAFAAITVTAMSQITEREAGLASGLITTGHELGAALGAALVSAIAFGSGSKGFETGYGHGALACAAIAGVLALASVVAIPTIRSSSGPQLAMH